DPNGRIWISTAGGLSVIDPARAAERSPAAVSRIEGMSTDGIPVDLKALIRVPPRSERITFTFAGLSLAVPQRVRFRYKLDGVDRTWSAPVNARETTYSTLSPGNYRFRLMIANSEGAWTESAMPVAFVVEPVFWQTRWFRMMSALTLAAI